MKTLRHLALMVLLALPVATQAQFTYTINGDNTITITGYSGQSGDIAIPDVIEGLPVTRIGDYAFAYVNLTNVMIGSNVAYLGRSSFLFCNYLVAITVDINNPFFTSVMGVLFNHDQSLLIEYPPGKAGGYVVPGGVTTIGDSAFDLSAVTSVVIPNGVTSIGSFAFDGCTSLTNILIPDTVITIGNYAFNNCIGLTNVTFPSTITKINDGMFDSCHGLVTFTIPNSVQSIGEIAFAGCTSLTNIVIPNSVTNMGSGVFIGC